MKFNKKVVFCGAFLGMMSANALAAPYVGVGLGYEDINIGYTDRETGFGDVKVDGLNASGYSGAVFGGLRFGEEKAFFAVELNYSNSNAEYKDSFEGSGTTFELKNSYGLGFLAGTKVNEARLYGRLGAQSADFDIDDGIGTDSLDENQPWGYRVGLGAEFPLGEMMALRADWSRTFYDEINSENPFTGRKFTYEPEQTLFQVGVTASF